MYSRLSTALFKSFEIEFGPYERDILRLSHDVRDEITLASKQAQKLETELQAEERQKAGMSRSILVKFRDKAHRDDEEAKIWRLKYDRRNLERKRLKVLNAFSTYDHQKTYRQIRKECVPGTCNWIYKNSEFKTWLTGTPRSLWCTGKCKLISSNRLTKLTAKNSRVREVGHKVWPLKSLYDNGMLMQFKRLCDLPHN